MPSPQLLVGRRSVIGNVYAITTICKDRCRVFDDPSNAWIAVQVLEALDHEGLVASFA